MKTESFMVQFVGKKVGNNSKENSRKRFCLVVAVPPDEVEFGVLQAPWQ